MSACDRHIVVRADASAAIGLGHVARSAALGHELAATGARVTICGMRVPTDLVDPLPVVPPNSENDAETLLGLRPDLVVADGYHLTDAMFAALDRRGVPYAIVDDNGESRAPHPIAVINQNPHAEAGMYAGLRDEPVLLLGPDFAMLRPSIIEMAGAQRRRNRTVFVAFGGSDPSRLTVPVAMAIASTRRAVRVAIGPAHSDRTDIEAALRDHPNITVTDPADYERELATADAAVIAAGSSMLEAAYLGTPVLAVVIAENQHRPAHAAFEDGMVRAVLEHGPELLARLIPMLDRLDAPPVPNRRRVTGDGARRVAEALGEIAAPSFDLRPASIDDAAFLFALRNDDDVRQQSYAAAPTWERHCEWLGSIASDPSQRLMIVESKAGPMGQVRLDREEDHDVVSISIAAGARGLGLGPRVLRALAARTERDLVANIKPDNSRSIRAFTRVGFEVESTSPTVIVMRYRRHTREGAQR